ncbi:MAG: hypothetical protein EBV03_01865 [Proteobacteria bacterium]|nr:hypothetical protein [Pseudomonadota bacterium]
MEELTFRDMLAIFMRRRRYFFITAAIILAISMIFVLRWSNYRSTATVQIEQSYVATNLTNANDVIVTLVDQRISQIQQKVTGLESLSEIINKFNLYPDQRNSQPMSAVTTKMRTKIKVDLISGSISNPAAAQKQTAEQLSAIAFNLSFDYSDPQTAQQVTDELVTRFLDEDLKQRRTQAQETSAFLATQIAALEANMAEQEKSIAEFRAKYGESGPAALMFNQQSAANVSMSLQQLESQLVSNEGTQGVIKGQLVLVDPYSRVIADGQMLTTPSVQLKALESQYAALTGQYGTNHPDVVKTRRQIAALKAQIGPEKENEGAQLEAQIKDVKTNLAAAISTKGQEHPDVVALQRKLKTLEAELSKKVTETSSEDIIVKDADNPAYLQLAAQLKTAEEQRKSLIQQRDALKEQQKKYEQMIAANPGLEQQFARLTRDYDNAQLRYRELREKKMAADMNEQLELGRKGQRLVVINPPAVPDSTQPRRALLVLGAVMLSLMGGLSSVIAAETLNQGVYGASHIAYLLGTPPLVVIPHLLTETEKNHASRLMPYLLAGAGILSVMRQLFLHFIGMPTKRLLAKVRARAPKTPGQGS